MSDKSMSDKPKPNETHPPRSYDPGTAKPMSDRDEARPGTPGTGEDIDPKTGETFNEGIGGA